MAGTALKKSLISRGIEVVGVARSNADITCDLTDESQLVKILRENAYDAYINAAALVNVDRCETSPLESWNVNSKLVSHLANFSSELEIPFLQISTDHFYTYGEDYGHGENDQIFCVNEYARHKYAAEAFALTSQNSLVVRTSILGSRRGGQKSLVEWAIESILKHKPIELFSDAWTSSLDVETFSEVALQLFLDIEYRGVINIGACEVYSKEKLIRNLANMLSIDHSMCVSGSVKRALSNRPNCLGLDVTMVENALGQKMPTLNEVCKSLISQLSLDKDVSH